VFFAKFNLKYPSVVGKKDFIAPVSWRRNKAEHCFVQNNLSTVISSTDHCGVQFIIFKKSAGKQRDATPTSLLKEVIFVMRNLTAD
jgi:hypothetical protein